MDAYLYWTAVAALGLLWGGFLAVAVYRLPQTAAAQLRRNSRLGIAFLATPASFCPRCKATLRPWHKIPVLSYVLLRGRCAFCGGDIGRRYPLIELGGLAIVIAAMTAYAAPVDRALAAAFLSFLLTLSVIDLRRYYLLDILTLPLLWLGLAANLDSRFALLDEAVMGAMLGYLALKMLSWAFSWVIKKEAIGGGDSKLFAAIGAWLGAGALPFVLFIAVAAGLALGLWRNITRGRGRHIPFGPCLSVAAVVMLFYGDAVKVAYWRFIGL